MAYKDVELTKKEIKEIRDLLSESKRPLFFFDSDADGLASFLLLYRYTGCGKGIIVKSQPELSGNFLRNVEEYQPDLVVILDIAVVSQDFVDSVKAKILYIDHHGPSEVKGTRYYNPRLKNKKKHLPTSYLCYQIAQQDLWIAMAGFVGDWFIDPLKKEFIKTYPDLLSKDAKTPQEALFESKIGKIAKIFNFAMKGTAKDAMKYVKVMTRIEAPEELLDQTTPKGKFVYKKFSKLNQGYEKILNSALKKAGKSKGSVFLFRYPEELNAFTSDLANETYYHHPEKVLIIARENDGEMKCSIRSKDINMQKVLKRTFTRVNGRGGGHPNACGASIAKDDFDSFIEVITEEIDEASAGNAKKNINP